MLSKLKSYIKILSLRIILVFTLEYNPDKKRQGVVEIKIINGTLNIKIPHDKLHFHITK